MSPFPLPSRLLATMADHTSPPPGTRKRVTEPQAAPPQAPSRHARTIPGNLKVCWSPHPQVGGPRGRPQAVWPGDLPVHLCPLRSGERGPIGGGGDIGDNRRWVWCTARRVLSAREAGRKRNGTDGPPHARCRAPSFCEVLTRGPGNPLQSFPRPRIPSRRGQQDERRCLF